MHTTTLPFDPIDALRPSDREALLAHLASETHVFREEFVQIAPDKTRRVLVPLIDAHLARQLALATIVNFYLHSTSEEE